MTIIILDKEDGPLIRATCPDCKATPPTVRDAGSDFIVSFACGASEQYEAGVVSAVAPCRLKDRA